MKRLLLPAAAMTFLWGCHSGADEAKATPTGAQQQASSQKEEGASFTLGPNGIRLQAKGQSGEDASFSLGPDGLKMKAKDAQGQGAEIKAGSEGVDIKAKDAQGKDSSVTAGPNGLNVDVKSDGASYKNNVSHTAEEMGVDYYPGSTPLPVASSRAEAAAAVTLMEVRTTPDSVSKVKEFYDSRTSGWQAISVIGDRKEDRVEYAEKPGRDEGRLIKATREAGAKTTTLTYIRILPKKAS